MQRTNLSTNYSSRVVMFMYLIYVNILKKNRKKILLLKYPNTCVPMYPFEIGKQFRNQNVAVQKLNYS